MKKIVIILIAALVLVPLLGVGACLVAQEIEERRLQTLLEQTPKDIVSRMSLEEKVGQIIHIGMRGKRLNPLVQREIKDYKVGGVILFAANFGNAKEIQKLCEDLQEKSLEATGIPLFISTDQEGGRVVRVDEDGTVQFPSAMALGQTGNPELAEDAGLVTGYELRKIGINLVLAPVLDVNNNPKNPVINVRSFGSRPELVSEIGTAHARGLRRSLSVPVIKHFPGHGDTDTDSHLALPRIPRDLDALEKTELVPFRKAIGEGAEAVMTAHILFDSLDKENPATLSREIIEGLLRKKLGFDGLVMTDAMEMHAISKRYTNKVSAKKAFAAGADVILLTSDGPIVTEMYDSLLEGFQSGELSVEQLDRAVERQVTLKFRRGLFHKWQAPRTPTDAQLKEYFANLEDRARQAYENVEAKYAKRGVTLNETISRAGVASLRKAFEGIPAAERDNVHVIFRSGIMRAEARNLGIAPANIYTARRSSDLYLVLKKRKAGEIWIVETDNAWLSSYNRLVRILEASALDRYKGQLIALHVGNPFLPMRVPANGAVLASFSPTIESRKALVFRALNGESVPAADLTLPEE